MLEVVLERLRGEVSVDAVITVSTVHPVRTDIDNYQPSEDEINALIANPPKRMTSKQIQAYLGSDFIGRVDGREIAVEFADDLRGESGGRGLAHLYLEALHYQD